MQYITRRKILAMALASTVGCSGSLIAEQQDTSWPSLLRETVDALGTGDQTAYERFVAEKYAPAVLTEYDVEDHASSLARIYADTGGFTVERIVGESPEWVQAEARDRITGVRYCLTLNRTRVEGQDLITDFSARGLYRAGPQLNTPSPDELVRTVETFADEYAKRGLLSGVILIAKDDDIIFKKAYGSSSLAYRTPVTLGTRLNTASISKSLTGVAFGQLVDAGKLSYDDTVGKLWPDYPDKDVRDGVTIRQLLTHTSGMGPDDYYNDPRWAALRSRLRSVSDYMTLVIGKPLGSEPGKYLYSNSGYVLLGAILERVTGQSYYDYVRDHIFRPAGMTHSFYHEMDQEDPDVAVPLTNLINKGDGYLFRLGRPRSAVYELAAKGGPQGGAYVTADDLFAFEKALRSGKLVSPERLKEMTTAQSPGGAGAQGLSGEVRSGLGVEVVTQNGHQFFGHTGGDLGIASFVYWYPDTGYTTIALTNLDPRATRVLTNVSRSLITRETIRGATPPPQTCQPPAKAG